MGGLQLADKPITSSVPTVAAFLFRMFLRCLGDASLRLGMYRPQVSDSAPCWGVAVFLPSSPPTFFTCSEGVSDGLGVICPSYPGPKAALV